MRQTRSAVWRRPQGRHAINDRRLPGTHSGRPAHKRDDNDAGNHAPAGAPSGHGQFAGGPHPSTGYERDQDDAEGNKHNAQHHSVLHVTYPWDWELAAAYLAWAPKSRWPVLVSTTVCALARLPPSRARRASTVTTSPAFIESRFMPARNS